MAVRKSQNDDDDPNAATSDAISLVPRNSRNKLNPNDLIFVLDGPYDKDNTLLCLV